MYGKKNPETLSGKGFQDLIVCAAFSAGKIFFKKI
jgi:hypothetical protein